MTNDALESLYDQIRAEEREALARRIDEARARAPRLLELDALRASLLRDVGARRVTAADGKLRLEEIAAEERELLLSVGMPPDALSLRVRCELCGDAGYVGAQRRPCACRLLYREALLGAEGVNERETFASFACDIFPTAEQKRRTLNAKTICETYAKALPAPEKPNLLLMGMPGLGKSFLGNAIAREALSRGVDSLRVSAYAFTQRILSDIRENTGYARRFQSVPLLVLDDLGSEPVIPNVSTEWLFAVVNERVISRLPSVCITNLTLTDLQNRYGERLMSRLCDRNTTQVLLLTGDNLRTR